jgi:hypothetical protein
MMDAPKGATMATSKYPAILCVAMIFCGGLSRSADAQDSIPGCEPPAELRTAMRTQLDSNRFHGVPYDEQTARQFEILTKLIEKYPREAAPQKELIELSISRDRSYIPAVQERFLKKEAENPTDPLALYAAGYSLSMTNPEESLRKLKKALELVPAFAWPNLALAAIYSQGKTSDSKAFHESVSRFFTLCANVTDRSAQQFLLKAGDRDLQRRVATELRKYLQEQKDPALLTGYETLWGLEFQTTPPQDFDMVRKRVTNDLSRIERLQSKPDAEFLAFLIRGYKQSASSPKIIKAKEDQILKDFPRSSAASSIASTRWDQEHKEPTDQKDQAAWAEYDRQWKAALRGWTQQFTDDRYVWNCILASAGKNESGEQPEKEAIEVFEMSLKCANEFNPPDYRVWSLIDVAQYLLKKKTQPERALDVLRGAQTLLDRANEAEGRIKTRSAEEQTKADITSASRRRGIVSDVGSGTTIEETRIDRKHAGGN